MRNASVGRGKSVPIPGRAHHHNEIPHDRFSKATHMSPHLKAGRVLHPSPVSWLARRSWSMIPWIGRAGRGRVDGKRCSRAHRARASSHLPLLAHSQLTRNPSRTWRPRPRRALRHHTRCISLRSLPRCRPKAAWAVGVGGAGHMWRRGGGRDCVARPFRALRRTRLGFRRAPLSRTAALPRVLLRVLLRGAAQKVRGAMELL